MCVCVCVCVCACVCVRSVMANVLDSDIVVNEFELQPHFLFSLSDEYS